MVSTGVEVKVATAPYFIATKLEAFTGRGACDFAASHDLEDVVAIVDGRESWFDEIRAEVTALLNRREFLDALPGYLLPALRASRGLGS